MNVAIKDIHQGINEFECDVSAQDYNLPDVGSFSGPIRLKIFVDRLENLFRFKISVMIGVNIACDRCLELFQSGVDAMIEQIYEIGTGDLDSDEIILISRNSKEIDISDAIQEVFVLNRRIKQLCQDGCKGLCPNCGINLNKKSCDCQQDNVDPRLEKLKSLLK